ncbi:MAG: hypothetical protein F6K30_17545 [Cyanothece sp. SIO2G6]|nr:hypothetical protein [Cyanothece sp. SIO2G6]
MAEIREFGGVAVADEGGGAVEVLEAIVVGGVAVDDSGEVAEFVEDGGEQVVASVGGGVGGGAEEAEFRIQHSEF